MVYIRTFVAPVIHSNIVTAADDDHFTENVAVHID